jgi:hypothetical protein
MKVHKHGLPAGCEKAIEAVWKRRAHLSMKSEGSDGEKNFRLYFRRFVIKLTYRSSGDSEGKYDPRT